MLLAAVLLMSVSAMAQSGNSDPLRGDLNGDGEVNMSDVMFLVQKILNGKFPDEGETTYYWYVGHVTNEQFENPDSLASIITTYGTATSDTTGPSTLTIPTTTGDVLVYIYPTIWGTPSIKSPNGFGTGDMGYEEVELIPPSGYNIRFWDGLQPGIILNIKWE